MQYVLSFIFLFIVVQFCHSQGTSGIAEYTVISKPIELEEDVSPLLKEFFESAGDDDGEMFFITLAFDEEHSFSTFGMKRSMEELVENPSYVNMLLTTSPDVCFNQTNKTISYNTTYKDTLYQITHNYDNDDWVFTGNKKTINGYDCKEAVLKHQYNENKIIKRVWYCEDISARVGPAKYLDFPGLVIFASGMGVEMRLINFEEKPVQVECVLEGIAITGSEMEEKERLSFDRYKKTLNKN